jgi:hypothetical protein
MSHDPLWLDLARFDPAAGQWRWDRLCVARAVPAAGRMLDVGAGVIVEVHVPHIAGAPLKLIGSVVSTAGERALIEGDPEASRGLVDALPGIEPWDFFAAVPIAAFRSRS